MAETVKILCIGDVVRKQGCDFLMQALPKFKKDNNIDVCIVNGENSANGDGMLKSSCESIFAAGADFITGGDHTLRRREFYDYLDSSLSVIRPANYGEGTPGKGFGIIDKGAYKVGVVNLLGTVWTDGFQSPLSLWIFTQKRQAKKRPWAIFLTEKFLPCSEHILMFKPRTLAFFQAARDILQM